MQETRVGILDLGRGCLALLTRCGRGSLLRPLPPSLQASFENCCKPRMMQRLQQLCAASLRKHMPCNNTNCHSFFFVRYGVKPCFNDFLFQEENWKAIQTISGKNSEYLVNFSTSAVNHCVSVKLEDTAYTLAQSLKRI